MRETDTIFALSTGAGVAAVAVVRLSGKGAADALRALSRRDVPPARRLVLRALHDPRSGALLDEALVAWLPGPESFTGEDMAELHLHGGRATVAAVLDALGAIKGLRMAQPGEFTRRAFEAGRMDLMEVEGLADLLRAETRAQLDLALKAMSGASSREVARWREGLVQVLARLEAAIDFIDEEDVAAQALRGLDTRMAELLADMERALDAARPAERLREGVRVVLAGPPNVGKSSLLNAIARREVAIVTDIPGTTRDVLETRLDVNGIPVILADTAGLRAAGASDAIERLGQARAQALLREADIVIWMHAPDVESPDMPRFDSEVIRLFNKSDLLDSDAKRPADVDLCLSVRTGKGMADFFALLHERVRAAFQPAEAAVVMRQRQRQALQSAVENLRGALPVQGLPLELVAEQVRLAVRDLQRLIGKVEVEELLDHIFAEFCIGK